MSFEDWKEQYRRANRWGRTAFIERALIGSPGAPAQAETNASQIWGHINAGYLFAYEYTRWWKESWALRHSAILGDWSWLNRTRVTGPDAERFLSYATVKDISRQQPGQIVYTPREMRAYTGDGAGKHVDRHTRRLDRAHPTR